MTTLSILVWGLHLGYEFVQVGGSGSAYGPLSFAV